MNDAARSFRVTIKDGDEIIEQWVAIALSISDLLGSGMIGRRVRARPYDVLLIEEVASVDQ